MAKFIYVKIKIPYLNGVSWMPSYWNSILNDYVIEKETHD